MSEEITMKGIGVSEGIAIGKPFFADKERKEKTFPLELTLDTEKEKTRFQEALLSCKEDLKKESLSFEKKGLKEISSILNAHLTLSEDPVMIEAVETLISRKKLHSEEALREFLKECQSHFTQMGQEQTEQIKDIEDVLQRVIDRLLVTKRERNQHLPHEGIFLSDEIVPSTAAHFSHPLLGIVTAVGGVASHSAIIARAKKIPFVSHVNIEKIKNIDVQMVIIDGTKGVVILNPTKKRLETYKKLLKKRSLEKNDKDTSSLSSLPISSASSFRHSKNHLKLRICANIESNEDILTVLEKEVEGVGLFRTEFLFSKAKRVLSEEEQFLIYSSMAKQLKNTSLVIRVADMGGDKDFLRKEQKHVPHHPHLYKEQNPALGCRGIRFLFNHSKMFIDQLRAIARASKYGDIKLLFPMITDSEEFLKAKEMFLQVVEDLKKEHVEMNDILIGAMIEVPSAALDINFLAKEADFLSIGTNDLTQYLLAIDRNNPLIPEYFYPAHPAILSLLNRILKGANKEKKPVYVCGEIGGDRRFTKLLLGMGFSHVSVGLSQIDQIREKAASFSLKEAKEFAKNILSLRSKEAVKKALSLE